MKFIDQAKIFIASGNGGKGCVAWRREKFEEFGGPDGGTGGAGGNIFIVGNPGLYSLYDLKMNPHIKAGHGQNGGPRNKQGKDGVDRLIKVPLGTVIYDLETKITLAEVLNNQPQTLLRGGKGGKGNLHFKSSTNQAPRLAQPGQAGVELKILLELKSIADVGLVGLPNVGKSSFLAAATRAQPKIGNYQFTTLQPNLGVAKNSAAQTFTIADIPGIIHGASQGFGLGLEFLRHIQRTSVLAFMIDASTTAIDNPLTTYQQLCLELRNFSKELLDKKKLVILTKCDLAQEKLEDLTLAFKSLGVQPLKTSAKTNHGIIEAVESLAKLVY